MTDKTDTKASDSGHVRNVSATDELRCMLDERGVEWKEHKHAMSGSMAIQRETLWGQPTDVASGKPIPHVYHYRATEMGDGRLFLEAQLVTPEQAVEATLGRGTLTADDVRDLIERHSDASGGNGRDFHNGAYVAIADELNATLGAGTCHNESKATEFFFYCSECGCAHLRNRAYVDMPRYCPNCGRKVKEES